MSESAGGKQKEVESFWDARPCESDFSGCPHESREYFVEIENERYASQPHIRACLSRMHWAKTRVLEIGTGVGTDARCMISHGAYYTGINLDQGSTDLTGKALELFALPGTVEKGDATALKYPDGHFDVVYAFGVLHHIPDAETAVSEIRRVLRPDGEVLVMLYNRSSINYRIEIMFLRKLFLRLLVFPGVIRSLGVLGFPEQKLIRHQELYRRSKSMSPQEWLSRNTDGPDNPYSRVYSHKEAVELFRHFEILRQEVYFFDHRHWGILGRALPRFLVNSLGRRWGWHRMVHARKPSA